MKSITKILGIFSIVLIFGCKNSPKVIKSVNDEKIDATVPIQSTGIFSGNDPDPVLENQGISTNTDGMHNVQALEVLEATKYVYVRVKEGDSEYWIATSKQDVEVGKSYFYREGLRKTNFESKEHNRIFDQIYLVSRIVAADHGSQASITPDQNSSIATTPTKSKSIDLVKMEGSVSIAEILDNAQKYEGKEVQISARCVKVNPNIMGRNWVHLEDGTQGSFDMVATTSIQIPEGNVVTLKGVIGLDVDFGAGYRYDVIMQDAVVLNMQ